MAELSDQDVFGGAAAGPQELSDAEVFAPPKPPGPSLERAAESAIEPITSLPSTYMHMVGESKEQMGRGVGQIASGEPWEIAKGIGNVALGGLNYVTSPINAPLHTIVGKPIEEATGSPTAGTLAELGAGFMLPVPHGVPRVGKAALPEEAPFGVTLSGGEAANDLAMRQNEQQLIRSGDPHGQAWVAQREAQLQTARDRIAQGFDPFKQDIAQTPQEAGELVSHGVQQSAANAKASVKQAYEHARGMAGEVHAGVFEGMSQGIKGDLTLGENPVIIDDRTTPFASKMIDDLDNRVSRLKIQNKADPFGAPNPQNITGVNLNGVDQMRKRLSSFRRDAYASGNAADGRAAQAVLNAFDERIDQAINGGQFTGDPAAVKAWNNARAANTDYRSTFTAGKNDPVGRVVQKILGDKVNDPMTAGNVIDQIIGSTGQGSKSLNIGVANRVKSILGEQSPEWIAVKQGLFRRLAGAGEGEAGLGTGQVAQRLSKFLNGDMAATIYTPQELTTLRSYANLNRGITMPPGSYFPSAPPLKAAMSMISNRIGAVIGAMVGRALIPGMPIVGELGGLTVGSKLEKALEKSQANVAKQLPIISQQMQQWSRAQSAAAAAPGNPMAQRAAQAAAINLQRGLTPLGINLKELMAQGPPPAQANQGNNAPGPQTQQKRGGAVGQNKGFAHGGKVLNQGFVPEAIGARKARNGKYYVRDPKRPGKYLMVVKKRRVG